jgi:hypothetical protein
MDRYFISTNIGHIHTNDEKMAQMDFTIDEMIYSTNKVGSILGEKCRIYFVNKNDKEYWCFDLGFADQREKDHMWATYEHA